MGQYLGSNWGPDGQPYIEIFLDKAGFGLPNGPVQLSGSQLSCIVKNMECILIRALYGLQWVMWAWAASGAVPGLQLGPRWAAHMLGYFGTKEDLGSLKAQCNWYRNSSHMHFFVHMHFLVSHFLVRYMQLFLVVYFVGFLPILLHRQSDVLLNEEMRYEEMSIRIFAHTKKYDMNKCVLKNCDRKKCETKKLKLQMRCEKMHRYTKNYDIKKYISTAHNYPRKMSLPFL